MVEEAEAGTASRSMLKICFRQSLLHLFLHETPTFPHQEFSHHLKFCLIVTQVF